MSLEPVLGVLGGSGLYRMPDLVDAEEIRLDTPYGSPSDAILSGRVGTVRVLFLPRHGRAHRIPPHAINSRANVCALKRLGATHLLSVSAVGSMQEHIAPGDFVAVDQLIDWTSGRPSTFFDAGLVAHVAFGDPVCPHLCAALASSAEAAGAKIHRGGAYLCIDGPQFSTRAESRLYRSWGVSVIGMTAMPEAKLAREAELPFAVLALVTDYDCWHGEEPEVTASAVTTVMDRNAAAALRTLVHLTAALPDPSTSPAARALASALLTAGGPIGAETLARVGWLVGKYLPQGAPES